MNSNYISIIERLEISKELKKLDEWVIKNLGNNAGIEVNKGDAKSVVMAGNGLNRYASSYYVSKIKELMNLALGKLIKSYYVKKELVISDSELKRYVTKVYDDLVNDTSSKSFAEVLNKSLVDIGIPSDIASRSSEALEEIYKKSLGYNPNK